MLILTYSLLGIGAGSPGHRGLWLRGLVVEDTAGKVLLQVPIILYLTSLG